MRQISCKDLAKWLAASEQAPPVLLDVRETWEFALCHLPGAQSIPMSTISSQVALLDENADIVVICHHGRRSYQISLFLEQQGFTSVYNLVGGVDRWAKEIDSSMVTY